MDTIKINGDDIVNHFYRVHSSEKDGTNEILLALFLQDYDAENFAKKKYLYTEYRVWVIDPYTNKEIWNNDSRKD